MRHTHTWTISGPGLSVSVNSITIIMEVVYLEFTQNEYHHHHQDHHHGSHNQQPECGYGVSCPQDDLCIYIWISVMITTQITEAVLTGYVDMGETIIGSFCLLNGLSSSSTETSPEFWQMSNNYNFSLLCLGIKGSEYWVLSIEYWELSKRRGLTPWNQNL